MPVGDRYKSQSAGSTTTRQKKTDSPLRSRQKVESSDAHSAPLLNDAIITAISQRLIDLSVRDPVHGFTPERYWRAVLEILTKENNTGVRSDDPKERMKALAAGSGFSPSQLFPSIKRGDTEQVRSRSAAFFGVVKNVIEGLLKTGVAPNPRNLKSVIPFSIGKGIQSDDMMNSYISELRNYIHSDEQLKRKYRRRAEFPDPTQRADAEVNRPTVQLKLRVDPAIAEAIDVAVAGSGQTRSEWMADAAAEKIKREKPEILNKINNLERGQPQR